MIYNDFRKVRKLGLVAFIGSMTFASHAYGAEVTLQSSDGTVNMTGEFVAFQDNAYIIATALGELRVAANRVSCLGEACPDLNAGDADIVISGSDTIGVGLMPLLLEGYAGSIGAAAELGNVGTSNDIFATLTGDDGYGDKIASFLVDSNSSNTAFSDLLNMTSEIAMSTRRIVPDEARNLRDNGAGNMISPNQEHILAVDSLVVITHPNNPIESLTTQQLQQIYSGQIANWSELGGPDAAITFVGRDADTGTRTVFEDRIFGGVAATLRSDATIADSNSDVARIVNTDEGAIGVVGYAFQRGAKALTIVNECGIRMQPDAFSARTEEYALQRRLYLYSREDTTSEETEEFLDFATSDAADALISKAGFIGFGVDRQEQSLESGRGLSLLDPNVDPYEGQFMRDMLGRMIDYDRLSTTFRFRTGSSSLDERGRIDLERLVNYLATQPEGSEIMFVGFTDDVGQFDGNRRLSEGRAAQVLEEVRAAADSQLDGMTMSSMGYGEIAPSGCNFDPEGRRINRRVEVWIKSRA